MPVYIISCILCYALLIVTISLPRRDSHSGISGVMWLLFTYLSIYVVKVFYMLCALLGNIWKSVFNGRNVNFFRWLGLGIGLVLFTLMWVGAGHTRYKIWVTHENFYSQKLPPSFEDYKIVQLSDLHVGTWGRDTTFISRLVDSVNYLHPDLIVFTGDLVNRKSDEMEPFLKVLGRLKAKDGVYSILGNHDYGDYVDWDTPAEKAANLEQMKRLQKAMGWKMLNNQSEFIYRGQDSILIVGVENWGEPPFPQYGDLDKALPKDKRRNCNQNDSHYKLLLSHDPEHWNQEVSHNTNIDLTLAGHTHGMQSMIKIGNWRWSPAKYRYDQWGGKYSRKNKNGETTELYVNIGSGAVGMPARMLSAYPEVTEITLKRGGEKETND